MNMESLIENLENAFKAFLKDAAAQMENGNKAAGSRARKVSLSIEKGMKEFRKKSIEASK